MVSILPCRASAPLALLLAAGLAGCCAQGPVAEPPKDEAKWAPLSLAEDRWETHEFGSSGDIARKDGMLVIGHGERLTGCRYTGELADLLGAGMEHYEIRLQARRTWGRDIFLGLTFPVGDPEETERPGYGVASVVLGGWGGMVCGISNVDGKDASSNAWKQDRLFEDGAWHALRLRVDAKEVSAWLDGKPLFAVPRAEVKRFNLHPEVEPTAPFGFFTFGTTGELKDIEVRRLD